MFRYSLFLLLFFQSLVSASDTFTSQQWIELEEAIDKGLEWLSTQQNEDGSIGVARSTYQPAHTSLAVMAFLSRGHQPGHGRHGVYLQKGIDFVLSTQDKYGFFVGKSLKSGSSTYSHAIAGTMLAEVIGTTGNLQNERIAPALNRGLEATIKLQRRHQQNPIDRGGWRYIYRKNPSSPDADLSVSTWHLLFLRAAKNANYNVPESLVIDGANFVRRCFHASTDQFGYIPGRSGTITMTGAGTLSLYLAGQYDDPLVKKGIKTIANYDFTRHSEGSWPYYTCYHCSQAATQAGGDAAGSVLTDIAKYLLRRQTPDGSWPKTRGANGPCYTTSMAILSLTPAYQILPIYQR